jgi:hypothetical protein
MNDTAKNARAEELGRLSEDSPWRVEEHYLLLEEKVLAYHADPTPDNLQIMLEVIHEMDRNLYNDEKTADNGRVFSLGAITARPMKPFLPEEA